jgi:hypothetical protein
MHLSVPASCRRRGLFSRWERGSVSHVVHTPRDARHEIGASMNGLTGLASRKVSGLEQRDAREPGDAGPHVSAAEKPDAGLDASVPVS